MSKLRQSHVCSIAPSLPTDHLFDVCREEEKVGEELDNILEHQTGLDIR